MILVASVLFGVVAYLGCILGKLACEKIVPFADGPKRGAVPVVGLIAGSIALGASIFYRGASPGELFLAALIVLVLVAGWASDVACGIIPDVFTLLPLAVLLVVRVFLRQWDFPFAGVLVFLPFALTASLSGGRGMGWGDVKLATLGGVLLGAPTALMSFIAASLVAVAVACARGKMREPIAFGPYLAAAIGFGAGSRSILGL
jgi:prepilin signal peptidase PulO-like enzyme (type II secretory pathway)